MKSPIKIPQNEDLKIHSQLYALLEGRLNKFYNENKELFDKYSFLYSIRDEK